MDKKAEVSAVLFKKIFILFIIYLAELSLSYDTWDLPLFVAAHVIFSCSMWDPVP